MSDSAHRVKCPDCDKKLRLVNVPAGKTSLRCPACGGTIVLRQSGVPSKKPDSPKPRKTERAPERERATKRAKTQASPKETEPLGPLRIITLACASVLGVVLVGYQLFYSNRAKSLWRDIASAVQTFSPTYGLRDGACQVPIFRSVTFVRRPDDLPSSHDFPYRIPDLESVRAVYLVTNFTGEQLAIIEHDRAIDVKAVYGVNGEAGRHFRQRMYRRGNETLVTFDGNIVALSASEKAIRGVIDHDRRGAAYFRSVDFDPKVVDVGMVFKPPFERGHKYFDLDPLELAHIPADFSPLDALERIEVIVSGDTSPTSVTIRVSVKDSSSVNPLVAAYTKQLAEDIEAIGKQLEAGAVTKPSSEYNRSVELASVSPSIDENTLAFNYSADIQTLLKTWRSLDDKSPASPLPPPIAVATPDTKPRLPSEVPFFARRLYERHGAEQVAIVSLKDVPDQLNVDVVKDYLARFDGKTDRESHIERTGDSIQIYLAPMEHLDELAEKIEFGEPALDAEKRTIEVTVTNPAALPRPPRRPRPKPPTRMTPRLQVTDEKTIGKVLDALTKKDAPNKREAIEYLLNHQPLEALRTKVSSVLAKTLEDPEAWNWDPVPRAFMLWMAPAEIPVLIRLTEHSSPFIRRDAIWRLAEFDDPRGFDCLVSLLEKDRGAAEEAFKHAGAAAEPVVIELLKSGNIEDKRSACKILEVIGSSQSVSALQEAARSEDFFLQVGAKRALEIVE